MTRFNRNRRFPRILRYLKYTNLKKEIHGYGYSYSFKKYLFTLFLSFAGILLAGRFFHLKIFYITALGIIYLCFFPIIIIRQFQYLYEQQRFRDVVNYLEQMIYSFKKQPKIIVALEETKQLCEGRILQLINEAEVSISHPGTEGDLYPSALSCIEQEYQCDRMKMLHDYLVKVENLGGQYQSTLNIILDDIKEWTERTYLFQKERKSMKFKIVLSLAASLGVAGTTVMMLSSDDMLEKVLEGQFYQVSAFLLLLMFLFLLLGAQKLLTGTWLKDTTDEHQKQIEKDFRKMREEKDGKQPWIITAVSFPILLLGFDWQNLYIIGAVAALILAAWETPALKKKNAERRLVKEVKQKFPYWLRGIALSLQTENVYVAIRDSLPDAPYVLKEQIEKLLRDIDREPESVLPYQDFLSEFELPEIQSAARMLYSLTNSGKNDSEAQINTLIHRNNVLMDKAEWLQNENEIAGIGVLTFVPMVLATFKMIIDLGLIFGSFFTLWTKLPG
ncbi:hypothetical protein [Anaerostipes sp.]|uniref:hypothetical protein n=1 Tax=Anaerostipes sp. TaxID=1872530 RepID=UPI0025BDF361|nr:hypothetical protein [Anaerostipes sp.]MBS7006960.1 hypothetical protein [Anaerostipes sp.]